MNYSMNYSILFTLLRIFIHFSCELRTALADFRRKKKPTVPARRKAGLAAALCRVPAIAKGRLAGGGVRRG